MKIRIPLLVSALLISATVSVLTLQSASAADLSDEQIERIKVNCVSIQGSLNQLYTTDKLLRVNRGQVYESIGTKLMNNFNARLGNNSLDNKGLVTVATQYQTALTAFRDDYRSYEQQLSATMAIDCKKNPTTFHASLEASRTKRALVHGDVIKLNQYIDDYRSAVNDFMLNFERVKERN